ncbi:MAG: terminase small subunit protein [Betaproteobacteria bacterium]|nr:terminase small subunit protein [Betaproteobacteria bacterium]
MPGGRPSSFTQETADAICERLANGESLRSITGDDGMPSMPTVMRWLADESRVEFRNQYARAREAQADHMAEEILEIADDASNDWMDNNKPDAPGYALNGEHVQRSRLRIDARKWLAAKMAPKKYGDKIETTLQGPNGGPVQVEEIRRTIVDPTKKPD